MFGPQVGGARRLPLLQPHEAGQLVWDEANLRAYIADPQGKVKGNRMPFGGMTKPKDLDDVIAYLKTFR